MIPSPELRLVLSAWDEAERAIKISEQITGQVAIPSVMELRYAGRRIADAFRALEVEKDEELSRKMLVDAEFDCLRAQHDAADVAVNYIAIFVDQLMQKVEPYALNDELIAQTKNFLEAISSFKESISKSRANRKDRSAIYKDVLKDLQIISDDFNIFKMRTLDMLKLSDDYHRLGGDRVSIASEALQGKKLQKFMQYSIVVASAVSIVAAIIQSFL